jgi:hypothetical protein
MALMLVRVSKKSQEFGVAIATSGGFGSLLE